MYGEIHILTGIIFQKAGPLEWAIPCSIISHFSIDSLNWGEDAIYHALGTGWRKWLTIFARVVLGIILAVYLFFNPKFLVCGLTGWLCFDWEWVISPLFHRHGFGLHSNMYPAFFRSKWGQLLNIIIIIILLGLVVS